MLFQETHKSCYSIPRALRMNDFGLSEKPLTWMQNLPETFYSFFI
jgi:hypothetical protein